MRRALSHARDHVWLLLAGGLVGLMFAGRAHGAPGWLMVMLMFLVIGACLKETER